MTPRCDLQPEAHWKGEIRRHERNVRRWTRLPRGKPNLYASRTDALQLLSVRYSAGDDRDAIARCLRDVVMPALLRWAAVPPSERRQHAGLRSKDPDAPLSALRLSDPLQYEEALWLASIAVLVGDKEALRDLRDVVLDRDALFDRLVGRRTPAKELLHDRPFRPLVEALDGKRAALDVFLKLWPGHMSRRLRWWGSPTDPKLFAFHWCFEAAAVCRLAKLDTRTVAAPFFPRDL